MEITVGRKPIGTQAMTAAERQRRRRQKLRGSSVTEPVTEPELSPQQPNLFDKNGRENEDVEELANAREHLEVIPTDVKDRARIIAGAISNLDLIAITGQEYWKVVGTRSMRKRAAHEKWIRNAHAKLTDLLRYIEREQ
jgi:hypothetical protein